eukprot:m.209618 g.209618  ORF g.209618 m.209618 type:complete len:135 (+) comp26108_c0_seq1:165-569(+)
MFIHQEKKEEEIESEEHRIEGESMGIGDERTSNTRTNLPFPRSLSALLFCKNATFGESGKNLPSQPKPDVQDQEIPKMELSKVLSENSNLRNECRAARERVAYLEGALKHAHQRQRALEAEIEAQRLEIESLKS